MKHLVKRVDEANQGLRTALFLMALGSASLWFLSNGSKSPLMVAIMVVDVVAILIMTILAVHNLYELQDGIRNLKAHTEVVESD